MLLFVFIGGRRSVYMTIQGRLEGGVSATKSRLDL
jgi:hypothetical protein